MNPDNLKDKAIPAVIAVLVLIGFIFTFAYGQMGFLPPNINSAYGQTIDNLYSLVIYTIGLVFFAVEGLLLYFLWRYRERPGHKASYTHGNNTAELVWTVIPGCYLLFLALYQLNVWTEIRQNYPKEKDALVVQVFPEQFAWNFRYQGPDGKFGTEDDATYEGVMFVPVNKKVLTKMASKDVIHSFFLPYARVKQDVLPGMQTRTWFVLDKIPCWNLKKQELALLSEADFNKARVAVKGYSFKSPKRQIEVDGKKVDDPTGVHAYSYELNPSATTVEVRQNGKTEKLPPAEAHADYVLHWLDIACAELCGFNHYTMRGLLKILPQDMFDQELASQSGTVDDKWKIWDENYPKFNSPPLGEK